MPKQFNGRTLPNKGRGYQFDPDIWAPNQPLEIGYLYMRNKKDLVRFEIWKLVATLPDF